MMRAAERPIGPTVLAAVEDTARWAPSNTNLGIILLFAPVARAALVGTSTTLRESIEAVLAATTVADARAVYSAIRIARPGGLGRAEGQDVDDEPTATLRDVMALATERDAIAREYAGSFAITFEVGLPAIRAARRNGLSWDDATVETYLVLLARFPDSLIARKQGADIAADVSRQAAAALAAGGVRSHAGRDEIEEFDLALRDPQNTMNPGTTADLTAAALFVALLDGDWAGGQAVSTSRPHP
jgi:triphosphoribosyl-dephospho-CoA synthase